MIAERVTNLADCTTEMDISGDNRSVVAGVLTDDPIVRVIIAYNSLVSTAGSQYIMDTYPENEQDEFAFFSGGVMGDEYEYLIGAVSEVPASSVAATRRPPWRTLPITSCLARPAWTTASPTPTASACISR